MNVNWPMEPTPSNFVCCSQDQRRSTMNAIIYLVGLVVVVGFILSLLGIA